jgi:hypothetical protein
MLILLIILLLIFFGSLEDLARKDSEVGFFGMIFSGIIFIIVLLIWIF